MSEELKSCPFCGGKAEIVECVPSTARFNEGAIHFAVACFGFNCSVIPYPKLWQVTKEDAIKEWNTRTTDQQLTTITAQRDELLKDRNDAIAQMQKSWRWNADNKPDLLTRFVAMANVQFDALEVVKEQRDELLACLTDVIKETEISYAVDVQPYDKSKDLLKQIKEQAND